MSQNSGTNSGTNTKSNSKSNSKRAATERLREERRLAERSARIRRRTIVGVASAAVLALAAGVAFAVGGSDGGAQASGPLVVPANASGADGTVVTYGKADAAHTLQVYEDFRCPYCQQLETTDGPTMQSLADDGTYKIEYHLATFLDKGLGGKGSRTALAAAGAALNEGVDKFKQFHDVLYANQPDERDDAFADVNHVLDLAGQVPGLRTDAFVKAVQEGTYAPWAAKVSKAFDDSGVSGTPTVQLDGKKLEVFTNGAPVTPDQYTALVKQAIG